MKQFPPFRKNWANCCHILFWVHKKKRRSRLSGRCGWKVIQSFHTQLLLSSERFSCWSKRFEPFFRHVSQMTRLSATQREPAVVFGWPELPDSHYWGSRKIHTLMWPVLRCVDKGKKAAQQRTVIGQQCSQSLVPPNNTAVCNTFPMMCCVSKVESCCCKTSSNEFWLHV